MSQLTLDFSDYDGSQKHRHIMSSAEKFPVATRRLKNGFVTLPGIDKLMLDRVSRQQSRYFIQHKITTTDEGKRNHGNNGPSGPSPDKYQMYDPRNGQRLGVDPPNFVSNGIVAESLALRVHMSGVTFGGRHANHFTVKF